MYSIDPKFLKKEIFIIGFETPDGKICVNTDRDGVETFDRYTEAAKKAHDLRICHAHPASNKTEWKAYRWVIEEIK